MANPARREDTDEIRLPRPAVRFPIELRIPVGFAAEDPSTYPDVDGRIEFVHGRLWYMPPTGDLQQDVVPAVLHVLMTWAETRDDFVVAGNEAGMILGGEVRGADAAVWKRADAEPRTGGYRRKPPVLAVEVAGIDDDETSLREKAAWYLAHGVRSVWLVFPRERTVLCLTQHGESRHDSGVIPPLGDLPALSAQVERFFAQLG